MVAGAWYEELPVAGYSVTPAEEPRRILKQRFSKSIAQKCSRFVGFQKPSKQPQTFVKEPKGEARYMLNASSLAEHDFGFSKVKILKSNSQSTNGSDSTIDPGTPSKHSEASLPGSVESDEENESSRNNSCDQQAELKRIAKQIGHKTNSNYRVIRNAFLAVDADRDGRLSSSEVASLCDHFGMSASAAFRFYASMEKDEHGNANWQKFMAVFAPVFKEASPEPPCYDTSRLFLRRGQVW